MRNTRWTVSWGLAMAVCAALGGSARAADTLRLLIIDGQNNHNWRAMTPPMKQSLEATGRFTVDVATTPERGAPSGAWDSFRPEFTRYDVVLSNYNGQPWPQRVQKALEDHVAGGGGLVIVHAANNAFAGWTEYDKMIGLGWRGSDYGDRVTVNDGGEVVRTPRGEGPGAGHGRPHEFTVVVRDAEHPVTSGMPHAWRHARDELYHGQRGPAQHMHILATAFSDKDSGGTGANEPMIWVVPYGKGRVFTTIMGHLNGKADPAIRCVGFQTVVARGAEWAATGKVTLPIPNDFPTADRVSLSPANP
jgi:type 1 glutamine amidotransferase